MASAQTNIGLIGFGEAGGIFAAELSQRHCRVTAYDVLCQSSDARRALQSKATAAGAELCATLAAAVVPADLIISAVTASASRDVAVECGELLRAGQFYLDINSVSPQTKQESARAIEQYRANYVEAAVMAPIPPQRLQVPILLGGPCAPELNEKLIALGMNTKVVAEEVGVASAIKMCRSIMIKGMEALTLECMFAARRYAAEEAVLASLHASFPSLGWTQEFPDYLISRIAEHGRRRAAEMREVAATLREVGLVPLMASATAQRHDDLINAMQERRVAYDPENKFAWRELADRINDRQ